MAIDEENLKSWASAKTGEPEPDGDEEGGAPDGDGDEPEAPGGTAGDEDLDTLVQLVEAHLPDIEGSAAELDAEELMSDEELSEGTTDAILSALEGMDAELSDELSGIEYGVANEIAEHFKEQLQDVTPAVFAAWLYRAGQLV